MRYGRSSLAIDEQGLAEVGRSVFPQGGLEGDAQGSAQGERDNDRDQ